MNTQNFFMAQCFHKQNKETRKVIPAIHTEPVPIKDFQELGMLFGWLSVHEVLGSIPCTVYKGDSKPSTQEMGAKESKVQGHPPLYSKFKF